MKMSAKKVLGLVLAGVLAAGSLTACGGGNNSRHKGRGNNRSRRCQGRE